MNASSNIRRQRRYAMLFQRLQQIDGACTTLAQLTLELRHVRVTYLVQIISTTKVLSE
jgi:hypothetical protein